MSGTFHTQMAKCTGVKTLSKKVYTQLHIIHTRAYRQYKFYREDNVGKWEILTWRKCEIRIKLLLCWSDNIYVWMECQVWGWTYYLLCKSLCKKRVPLKMMLNLFQLCIDFWTRINIPFLCLRVQANPFIFVQTPLSSTDLYPNYV